MRNSILNLLQLACFIGIIYITWLNHIPSSHMFAIILFAVILDVLSGYQTRKEVEKEMEIKNA